MPLRPRQPHQDPMPQIRVHHLHRGDKARPQRVGDGDVVRQRVNVLEVLQRLGHEMLPCGPPPRPVGLHARGSSPEEHDSALVEG